MIGASQLCEIRFRERSAWRFNVAAGMVNIHCGNVTLDDCNLGT